jgi:hypothetical protein
VPSLENLVSSQNFMVKQNFNLAKVETLRRGRLYLKDLRFEKRALPCFLERIPTILTEVATGKIDARYGRYGRYGVGK